MKTTAGYSGQQGTHRDDFGLLPPVKSCFLICQTRQGLFSEASKIAKAFDKFFVSNSSRDTISEDELGINQAYCVNFLYH